MNLDEVIYAQAPPTGQLEPAVWGQAANTVSGPGDDLYVTIPSVDGGVQQFGPCPWSPSTAYPAEGDDLLVIFDERETPWVIVLAPPGGGIPGGGDLTYVFTQLSPASSWPVTHGLGKFPSVSVVDSGGTELLANVVYVDLNNVLLTFGSPTSGKAYMN